MAVSRSDLKAGKKVRVEAFDAVITEPDSAAGTAKLREKDGTVHYVSLLRLTIVPPYENGKVYLSARGVAYYYFKLDADGTGSWLTVNGREPRAYDLPERPMTEVTIGTDEFTD